jgi:hypothetical protein
MFFIHAMLPPALQLCRAHANATAMQDHFVDLTMHKTGSRTTRYLMNRMVEFIDDQPIWRLASSPMRKPKRNMDSIRDGRLASAIVV